MAAFLKNLARMLGPSKADPAVYLSAFGKHPGWNDHIDDLGLDTDDLVTAKRLLYMQGINQNIDAGAWESLEPSQRIDSFRHDFLWHMRSNSGISGGEGRSLIAGRFWSSVDGKGRDKYPMVLCAATVELPDSFAAQSALPALAKTHERCAAATSADQIRKIIDADRESLRALLAQSPPPNESLQPAQIVTVASCPELAPSREGFHRIVYQIACGMSAYRPNSANSSSSRSVSRRSEQIRVPLCGLSPAEALLFWLRFTLTLLDPAVPILLLAPDPAITRNEFFPDSAGWIDIIVGEPTAQNLFCIKASTKSLPLTSEIPYTLERSFCNAVNHFVDACATTPPGDPLPAWPGI